MTTIWDASKEAAILAASRIVDADDILEFSITIQTSTSQCVRNVKVHCVALADGGYSVESIEDVENIFRGEVIL